MAKIGIGIIGTGSIVHTYRKAIEELEDAELIALYTKSEHRAGTLESQLGTKVFSDMHLFMEMEAIDLVCICNESGNHGQAIMQSAMAGKHVLCEKPLEVTTQKIDDAIAFCQGRNVILGCVFQNRYNPEYRLVRETVSSGKLGTLLMGNAHINWYRTPEYYANNSWRGTLALDGGAAFMNQGIHTIDLLLDLFGEVKSVVGYVDTRVHHIEGEDVGSGILRFANGALGNITAGTALYPGYPERLEVYGEKGSILMEGGQIKEWNVKDVPGPERATDRDGSGASDPTAIGHADHKAVLADMIQSIREDRPPMVDGASARKSVEVITALYRSSKEGKVVML